MGRIEEIGGELKDTVDRLLRAGTSQRQILEALKPLCEAAGEAPISAGGLNRYATKWARIGQDIRETEQIAQVWVKEFGERPSQAGALIVEMLKSTVFRLIARFRDVDDDSIDADEVGALALAVQRLERTSAVSDERLRRLRAEIAGQAEEESKRLGISPDTAAALRRALTEA
ncbi:MAG: DUF3486 family protein [Alphaproteobacteria bacterium]|nr:DUF3486 family protein [Alphaproteobacteria bacterium]